MRSRHCLSLIEGMLCLAVAACRHTPHDPAMVAPTAPTVPPTPQVLQLDQGERRTRRGSTDIVILKVDAQNGGSSDLVMGYELVPLGHTIAPHRHLDADEIIFVHDGSGVTDLGGRRTSFGPGATIYIPKDVRVSVQNTGPSHSRSRSSSRGRGLTRISAMSRCPKASPRRRCRLKSERPFARATAHPSCTSNRRKPSSSRSPNDRYN